MTVLLEGVEVEVVDIRHVVVEAVADKRKTERAHMKMLYLSR